MLLCFVEQCCFFLLFEIVNGYYHFTVEVTAAVVNAYLLSYMLGKYVFDIIVYVMNDIFSLILI